MLSTFLLSVLWLAAFVSVCLALAYRRVDLTTSTIVIGFSLTAYSLFGTAHWLWLLLLWIGFAVATWSLGAVFVLAVTAGNLIPRAFQLHRWYLEKFPDYPKDRKALIPFVC